MAVSFRSPKSGILHGAISNFNMTSELAPLFFLLGMQLCIENKTKNVVVEYMEDIGKIMES